MFQPSTGMSNYTKQYLAKVAKTLKPHNLTIEQFKENPFILAHVSKSYERYLINKYKGGNDFKWWDRPTDLYKEAFQFQDKYGEGKYIMDVMQADPKMWQLYVNESQDNVSIPEENLPEEVMQSLDELIEENTMDTLGIDYFFVL